MAKKIPEVKLVPVVVAKPYRDQNKMQNYQLHMIPHGLLSEESYVATVPTSHDLVGLIKAFQAGQENPDAKG